MTNPTHYEVIIVGAGVSGIYQMKCLADLGIEATVIEAADDLGGTWHFNRYPGARFDSESYTYGYSFSKELLNEWHWKEGFSGQPENLRYLHYVVEKFDLRQHMQFNCRVTTLRFDEARCLWQVFLEDGRQMNCRFIILTIGLLSVPTMPRLEGLETFAGRSFHTFHWPQENLDLPNKRLGIIGTGATAIQIIGEIADKVGELWVFQRRPNWVAPLNNYPISAQKMEEIRARYDEIFATCARTPGGFEHEPDRRGFYEVSRAERIQLWDRLYEEPGFGIWLQNFREIFLEEQANAEFSEYIAQRMRQRVHDPQVAEKLIPKDHGFGIQRVPLETHYLEAYNRENVHLVDIHEAPLERITPRGIKTIAQEYELDIIVYATGFDAITGAFEHIDIRGTGNRCLKDDWRDSPATFLGMLVHGYPNLFMPIGPQSASATTNFPRGIESGVDWCTDLLQHLWQEGHIRVEATAEAQKKWVEHVRKTYSQMLLRKAKGWFTGYNSNVEGHEAGKIRHVVYTGGAPKYRAKLQEVTERGYEGLVLGQNEAPPGKEAPRKPTFDVARAE